MEKVLVCIPDDMIGWVRKVAKSRECSVSDVFRQSIELLYNSMIVPDWSKKAEKKFVKALRGNCDSY